MLANQLSRYVAAAFSGIWIVSNEAEEAEEEIIGMCAKQGWKLAVWDCARGIRWPQAEKPLDEKTTGPRVPLNLFFEDNPNVPKLIVLHNYHRFLDRPELIQHLVNALVKAKERKINFIILSPMVVLPAELDKLFVILDHQLPTEEQLRQLAQDLKEGTEEYQGELDLGVVAAGKGLTRREFMDALSLSFVDRGCFTPEVVWEQKHQIVKKKPFLELHTGGGKFRSLGGMDGLKQFTSKILRPNRTERARGVLLVGPAGVGKSAFARALGNETGRPTLLMDMGRMYSKYVGESEGNIKNALDLVDALAPAILFVDELEKALAGLGSEGDSGVAARIFGKTLTWLSDHTSDVFFIGTSNDIGRLPPEFSRAERFDGVFYIDLPTTEERPIIWDLYDDGKHGHPPNDTDWTGAEIKSCTRLAKLMECSLADAANYVVPVAKTAGDRIKQLRDWSIDRCLDAANGGIYKGPTTEKPTSIKRKLGRPGPN